MTNIQRTTIHHLQQPWCIHMAICLVVNPKHIHKLRLIRKRSGWAQHAYQVLFCHFVNNLPFSALSALPFKELLDVNQLRHNFNWHLSGIYRLIQMTVMKFCLVEKIVHVSIIHVRWWWKISDLKWSEILLVRVFSQLLSWKQLWNSNTFGIVNFFKICSVNFYLVKHAFNLVKSFSTVCTVAKNHHVCCNLHAQSALLQSHATHMYCFY